MKNIILSLIIGIIFGFILSLPNYSNATNEALRDREEAYLEQIKDNTDDINKKMNEIIELLKE